MNKTEHDLLEILYDNTMKMADVMKRHLREHRDETKREIELLEDIGSGLKTIADQMAKDGK